MICVCGTPRSLARPLEHAHLLPRIRHALLPFRGNHCREVKQRVRKHIAGFGSSIWNVSAVRCVSNAAARSIACLVAAAGVGSGSPLNWSRASLKANLLSPQPICCFAWATLGSLPCTCIL